MSATPELAGYEGTETGEHFRRLRREAAEVLAGERAGGLYEQIEQDAEGFAPSLAVALRDRSGELVCVSDEGPRAFAAQQGPHEYAAIVERLLSDGQAARAHHRGLLSGGLDPFGAFEGRWSGVWFHNNRAVGAFDHHWQETRPLSASGHILIQPVVMGSLSMEALQQRRPRLIGSDSSAPVPAVDAASQRSGWIIGAVGYEPKTQRASRPHVGYLWTRELLIWVALEANGSPEAPRYSCFFERRDEDGSYRIVGVQLLWERAQSRITFESFMGSIYHNPITYSAEGERQDETCTKGLRGYQSRDDGR